MFLTSTCTKKRECYHAHSLLRGSGKTLHQEQTITSTPICTSRTISVVIYISEDVYCTILFRGVKFSGFRKTKTSVNKRLFMSAMLFIALRVQNYNNILTYTKKICTLDADLWILISICLLFIGFLAYSVSLLRYDCL